MYIFYKMSANIGVGVDVDVGALSTLGAPGMKWKQTKAEQNAENRFDEHLH